MFDDGQRMFGQPPGVDFATALVDGLTARLHGEPPETLGRVTLLVNTRRMQRRVRDIFDAGPARLLPRIRLVGDLASDPVESDLPLPVPALRRRLELSQLVSRLLERQPDLGGSGSVFGLSDSLARLLDEMHGEGVAPEDIFALDVGDQSAHWARSLSFLEIAQPFFDTDTQPGSELRQRRVVEALAARWRDAPPTDPVVIAGSTGSRGATAVLMEAVARLPQGAVVLPGFDFDMPPDAWDALGTAGASEDHPQARFRSMLARLDLMPADVRCWHDGATPPRPERNRLISLSLRPAPVTDQWRRDAPALGDLAQATDGMTLIEAPTARIEAEAIALRLRRAVDDGITAAVVTPDRMLTRQITAALDRWNIVPDDSAGQPLSLSPPGRLLRQICALRGGRITGANLLALLKHPLCHAGAGRREHLLMTRDLERYLRRRGVPFPTASTLADFVAAKVEATCRIAWAAWVTRSVLGRDDAEEAPLARHVADHIAMSETLSAGPDADISPLWDEAAGREARATMDELLRDADAGGVMSSAAYADLFGDIVAARDVRDRDRGHPRIRIWGTLESRVQGADLTILAGLNEGIWPEMPGPDPWLNRAMRAQVGLLLPERQIGLSAHDYMQAVAGREVWITRAARSSDAPTVPSRWIGRLTNLLDGLPDQGGPEALAAMRNRGAPWLRAAAAIGIGPTTDRARRPSPRPPRAIRPKTLSVSGVSRLIRDPYAVYAARVLRLRPLDPLTPLADAALRGTVLHRVFEQFVRDADDPTGPDAAARLIATARQVLARDCPWPAMRHLWLARIARIADWFVGTEAARQAGVDARHFELTGTGEIAEMDFTLTARADRIDLLSDGGARIYDYKTGKPPTRNQQIAFEKQLLLEAALAERGGFADIGAQIVAGAEYIGVGSTPAIVAAPLDEVPVPRIWAELRSLIGNWQDETQGYTARMAPDLIAYAGDYDHLSRHGEWEDSDPAHPEDMR